MVRCRVGRSLTGKRGIQTADIIIPFVLALFLCSYLYIAGHSVNVPDESLYLNFAHRFFLGDRPVVDEWGIEQFTGILLLIPFSIYYSVTHTTDGVILFFRVLAVVCQLLVSAYIYISLRVYANRKYKTDRERMIFSFGALVAVIVYMCFIPLNIPALSYYAMSLMGLAVLSVTLICYPPSKLKYYFCGVIFAAVILAEPEAILLHILLIIVLFVIRLINRISGRQIARHLFEDRFLLFLNLGGYTVFAIVMTFIQIRVGCVTFLKNLPHIFDGTGYVFSGPGRNVFDLTPIRSAIGFYGPAMIGLLAVTVLAAVLYKQRVRARAVLAPAMSVLMLWVMIRLLRHLVTSLGSFETLCLYHGLPLYLSGPAWMLMEEKPDRKVCTAWFVCAAFSVLFSLSSRIAVGWGGVAAGIFSVILAFRVIAETTAAPANAGNGKKLKKRQMKQAEKEKALSRIACVAVSVFCLISLTTEALWFRQSHWVYSVETINREDDVTVKGFDTGISDGPLRGIRTTAEVAGVYDALDMDFETIRHSVSEGQTVCIQGRAPLGYLAVDRGYGVFSTWFRSEEFSRSIKYWTEHPEKLPEYIYVPYYDMYTYDRIEEEPMAELMDDLTGIFRFDRTEGEAGAILRVTGVSLPRDGQTADLM